jgi:hypothetical protein
MTNIKTLNLDKDNNDEGHESVEEDSSSGVKDSNKLLSIDEIKGKINDILKELSGKLNCEINENYLPTYGIPKGDGTPYIITNENGYNYIYSERGFDFQTRTTNDIDELLFWTFEDFVFSVVDKRDKKREEWFKEEEDILMKINTDWANLLKERNRKILLIWK